MPNGSNYTDGFSRAKITNMHKWVNKLVQQLSTSEMHLDKFIQNVIAKHPCRIEELNNSLATSKLTNIYDIKPLSAVMQSTNMQMGKLRKLSFAYVPFGSKRH